MHSSLFCAVPLCVAFATALAPAQVIYYHGSPDPYWGDSDGVPFYSGASYSSLHVYRAAELHDAGVSPGSVLTDLAVNSVQGGVVYTAPTARVLIGHVAGDPLLPTGWLANLDAPTVVHDTGSGPYTLYPASSTWISMPGFAGAGFTWDGVRDIGLFYTSSGVSFGQFSARRWNNSPRFGAPAFNATNQTSVATGHRAMKVRMTFSGTPVQANSFEASLTINGSAGASSLYSNEILDLTINSTTAAGYPFFLLHSTTRLGGSLPAPPQALDIGSPSAGYSDLFLVIPGGSTPFLSGPILPLANLAPPGRFQLLLDVPCSTIRPRQFVQAVVRDPLAVPSGWRLSGSPSFDVKPGCRFASANTFPIPIPDAGPAITAVVNAPSGLVINDIDVRVGLTHPRVGDLTITLARNGLATVPLHVAAPSNSADLEGLYHFTDESSLTLATAGIQSLTFVLPGRYLPNAALAAFDGQGLYGTWTLSVQDTAAGIAGSLTHFSIVVNGTE